MSSTAQATPLYRVLFQGFSSLRLTVVLLTLGMLLIFFGTLDQVHLGIRGAQLKYFQSLLALWQYPLQWPAGDSLGWLKLPVPGGLLVGGLLAVNLVCAHVRYFKPGKRNIGIGQIHVGILLLILGQFYTDHFQEEYRMRIDEGDSANYLESFHQRELVVIETSDPETDKVVAVPVELMEEPGSTLTHGHLPFQIRSRRYYPNASLVVPGEEGHPGASPFTEGIGAELKVGVIERPETFAQDETNLVTAEVEFLDSASGDSLGVWLASLAGDERLRTQQVEHGGRTFAFDIRPVRKYLPYRLELINFQHDLYEGTTIPRNYLSEVRLVNPETGEDRPVDIWMNHPLRYGGLTFYQSSFDNNDTTTIFQVVRNPGWTVPYIACSLVTLGLLTQFSLHLNRFRRRQNKS